MDTSKNSSASVIKNQAPSTAQGTVVAFIPDGFADWEAGFACAEINKPETGYSVSTMALDRAPKRSIGGWTLLPDYTLNEVPDDLRMLILVGGESWFEPCMAEVLSPQTEQPVSSLPA